MTISEFTSRITATLGFAPTADQQRAMDTFGRFLADMQPGAAMVMRGSAGTGKTSLAAAMVRTLAALHQRLVLLAPTGRAAKVFAHSSGLPAHTIHRRIYREQSYQGLDGQFRLNRNQGDYVLFVVDEASMIASGGQGESSFGSGSLIDDLIEYVYSGPRCRLLLIGDTAQLPPVGEEESPALDADVLRGYGLRVYEADLHEVVRQAAASGLLWNATQLRTLITHDEATRLPVIRLSGFADVCRVPGDELVEAIATSYSRVGLDQTIVITRSNKRANIYNQGIRAQVLDREEALSSGDMLMVVRNNYYWAEQVKNEDKDADCPITFMANGDVCRVERMRHERELYGFHFADVRLSLPDYDDYELMATVLMDTLTTEAPALPRSDSERLYTEVMADYADLPTKAERVKSLRRDPHFNALQVKFAYAVTCHKAQGGQWEHVYLDQGYMTDDMLTPDYIHWLYTAFTRATSRLFLVNWPDSQAE